jgi:hypothetical protein
MVSTAVVIGRHTSDNEYRTWAAAWIDDWWTARGMMARVGMASADPWCKADAYNTTVRNADADIVIIADADTFAPTPAITWAIEQADEHGWAVPFTTVHRLNAWSTYKLVQQDPSTEEPTDVQLDQPPHDAVPGGGIVVMRRDLATECGPFDPRFQGWGGEDFALGLAARTLTGCPAPQYPGPLWHLWHPPQPRTPDTDRRADQLVWTYRAATYRPREMRAVIQEGRQAWTRHG